MPYTKAQNEGVELSIKFLIVKAWTMRVYANLAHDLWPLVLPAIGSIMNRIPKKNAELGNAFRGSHLRKAKY